MELKDFDYDLPEDLIAQHPLAERDSSRLLTLDRRTGAVKHGVFGDLASALVPGDCLVLNDTRVLPSRVFGKKPGGGRVELLLVEKEEGNRDGGRERWLCMARPAKGIRAGTRVEFGGGVAADAASAEGDGFFRFEFSGDPLKAGVMPLPPYIRREAMETDLERYQTVFAQRPGAVAAPTAGLHFTARLLAELTAGGVEVRFITLHTGPGTFLPVRTQDVGSHKMLPERYRIGPDAAAAIGAAKREGRRVIAVGTTVVRTLETAFAGKAPALEGKTSLFILPGHRFRAVDALVTNFHLPRSTLLMLVAAFAGREKILDAYKEAVKLKYRFYSYGDAMFII